MPIKLVLFDWDMTLANTLSFKFKILRLARKEYKLSILRTVWKIRKLLGLSAHEVFERIFGKNADLPRLMKEYKKAFRQYSSMIKFKGKQTIKDLKKHGYKVGIITNELKENVDYYLKKNKIKVDLLLSTDHFHPKPDPKTILYAMKKLKAKKLETVYIGDHPNDILLGKRAGVYTIGIRTALHRKRTLKKYRPDLIARSIKKVNKKLLDRL